MFFPPLFLWSLRLCAFAFVSSFEMKKSNRNHRDVLKVGLTQMSCSADVKTNRAKQVRLVEQAAKKGASIVCTQELFTSQYFCQVEDHRFFKLAETIPGPSTDALPKIAKKYKT